MMKIRYFKPNCQLGSVCSSGNLMGENRTMEEERGQKALPRKSRVVGKVSAETLL